MGELEILPGIATLCTPPPSQRWVLTTQNKPAADLAWPGSACGLRCAQKSGNLEGLTYSKCRLIPIISQPDLQRLSLSSYHPFYKPEDPVTGTCPGLGVIRVLISLLFFFSTFILPGSRASFGHSEANTRRPSSNLFDWPVRTPSSLVVLRQR